MISEGNFLDSAENDKENDRSGQATQAVIQRRKRPKRRSTGVVHVDMEVRFPCLISFKFIILKFSHSQDIDPEYRQDSPVDNGDDKSLVSKMFTSYKCSILSNETR